LESFRLSDLLSLLVCPVCRGALSWMPDEARCQDCGHAYAVADGIPVLVPPGVESDAHKRSQAEYADHEDPEWEITRPHGSPEVYRWLLDQKFVRSTSSLGDLVPGATALTVCGGYGMDAEFLARAGASVIASDLSLRAVSGARRRAEQYGFEIQPVVADVEALPLADGGVDLVYVHDGLHHLIDPLAGLEEMARVAAHAVSVNEPARAALTGIAVKAGLSMEVEPSGNRVERMGLDELADGLESRGFRVVERSRYAMLYRHRPGPIYRFLSLPPLRGLAKLALRGVDLLLGRAGNKLTVQARR
jgi:uncharacterized protein YbaR (Trm112 family)